jgi:2-polyprenyl-3-methyl-5-hydroxy-6-metoxy-1,4-benzoquinol methylase
VTIAYEITSCVVCGSASSRELATADDMRREVEELWAFHSRRLRADTPPAHLMDRVAFSQHAPLRVVRCSECGLVFRNPIERPEELEAIYDDARLSAAVMRALHDTQRAAYAAQAARLTRTFRRRGGGIEVGSYVGGFLRAARDAGWQFSGVDVNPDANEFARSLGFQVHDGTIESLDAERRADVVAIWNCLDQLADPAAALRAARSHLSPGGMIALRVPNGACWAAFRPLLQTRLAPLARGWLAQNNLLGFPYRYGFTPTSATRLLARLGLTVERVYGDVLVPIADRWTRRWAALEEGVLKRVMRAAASRGGEELPLAPWFEVYARVDH